MEQNYEGYLTSHCEGCPYWIDDSTWDSGCRHISDHGCPYIHPKATEGLKRYVYVGPVMMFETCVAERWAGETIAVSEQKARNNLCYRWKKENGYIPNTKISLPGSISEV